MTVTVQTPASPARRPGVNGWLVVGGILTIITVILGGLSVASWLGYRTETQTQVYRTNITELDIDLTTGDLRVKVGASDSVVVTRRLHWSFTKPTFNETFDGQRLTVTQSCGSVLQPGPNCGVDYTVEIPAGTSLTAQTDTGDIAVEDIRGPVSLQTSTGDISVTGTVGDLSLHAGTGSVTAVVSDTERVDVSTDTGDITLQLAEPPQAVTANSGTGDVHITVPQGGTYHVRTDVGTGDAFVTVHTSDSSAQTITVQTGTGDISIVYL